MTGRNVATQQFSALGQNRHGICYSERKRKATNCDGPSFFNQPVENTRTTYRDTPSTA
jgi:hypothetical protein